LARPTGQGYDSTCLGCYEPAKLNDQRNLAII